MIWPRLHGRPIKRVEFSKMRWKHDGKKLRKKWSFNRKIKHESVGLRQIILCLKAHKYYCSSCNKYFNQRFPGIGKHQRATENLKRQVFHHHTQGASQKDLAYDLKVGKATIERWYHQRYWHEEKRKQSRVLPRTLGIDEHFFSKKEGYATTFCNLAKNKIFDIVKGRSAKDLESYLKNLPHKERVKVICIDLSSTYRHIVGKYFPNAKIVADRFHVIRLMNHMAMQTCHAVDSNIKYQRGILAALKTPENLTVKRLQYCYPLTITDFYSRYLLACEGLETTKEKYAFTVFERVFKEFGLPRE